MELSCFLIIKHLYSQYKFLILKVKVKMKSLSRVRLCETLWTVPHQAPPFMGFSRQEYWSGLSFPSPGDLPDSGIKPWSPALRANALPSELCSQLGYQKNRIYIYNDMSPDNSVSV